MQSYADTRWPVARNFNIAVFVHTLRSDWNNGNAHFLRGLVRALAQQGNTVTCLERESNWSMENLRAEGESGHASLSQFKQTYPDITIVFHNGNKDLLRDALRSVEIVLVHEWNEPELVSTLLELREEVGYRILFHDTHHRASSSPQAIAQLQVARFDGVLAFGEALRQIYRSRFDIQNVWALHEAADITVFHPRERARSIDVVWIGNWGDGERSRELCEYLLRPACELRKHRFLVHGVRYPEQGLGALRQAGIEYGGYQPNLSAPELYASAKLTVHVPRQQYNGAMAGIPTIRVFEALASGIPLISAPWQDTEGLFRPGDYCMVSNGREMVAAMQQLLADPVLAREQASRGLDTVLSRHTCRHRACEFISICEELTA